jgi:hypothetical protein
MVRYFTKARNFSFLVSTETGSRTSAAFSSMGKGKAIPLQALTGPEGSRSLRLPDFKTIGTWSWQGYQPYAPAAFTPRKYSWYSFLLEAQWTQGHSVAGRIMSMKNSNDTIGNRPRDLPVCSAVPQPLRQRIPPLQWILGAFSPGVNRLDREADFSHPTPKLIIFLAIYPPPHMPSWREREEMSFFTTTQSCCMHFE